MCGIFGVSRLTDTTKWMLPHLAWDMESRGKDSWGCTNGVDIIKHLGPIHETWMQALPKFWNWSGGIFHTRAASTGAITVENQHPFTVESFDETDGKSIKTIIGIHNGIVSNHEALNRHHNRNFDCDSPHIFMALAGFSETSEILGYGNLAWYEITQDNPIPDLHLLRFNNDALHIAYLTTGELVFASLKDSIIRAATFAGSKVEKFYEIQGDTEYRVMIDPTTHDKLERVTQRTFGLRASYQTTYQDSSIHRRGYHTSQERFPIVHHTRDSSKKLNISMVGAVDRLNNVCLVSGCSNKVTSRRKEVLCSSCMNEVIQHQQKAIEIVTS